MFIKYYVFISIPPILKYTKMYTSLNKKNNVIYNIKGYFQCSKNKKIIIMYTTIITNNVI